MSNGGVRGGVPRELIVEGIELDPAEGETMTYYPSGRGGPVHMSGNNVAYGESNPHAGFISQTVSVSAAIFKKLKEIQNSGRFVPVTATTAGNEILDGSMKISNDGPLENDNGTVALELAGTLSVR